MGQMSEATKNFYFRGPGGFANLGPKSKKDYYIECAAIFRKTHLK